jgi:multidrug efflux pump subunit AcrB
VQEKNYEQGIISWFVQNSVAANLLMMLIIILGILHVNNIRKEAFPSMEPDSLTVSVTYQSGSSKLSEEGLALKIEEALEGLTGIKSMTSSATGSGVTVTVEKTSGYDLDILLRDVKNKVDSISTFPTDAKSPVIEKAEREEHSIWIQLYGDTDRQTLQLLADNLKSDLLANSNINRVSISGRLDPIISIEVDESLLQAYSLSMSDIENSINDYSSRPMSAVLKSKTNYLQLQASKQAYQKRDFEIIPIITIQNGRQVLLGDIAQIKETYSDDTAVLSRFNAHNSLALEVLATGVDDITNTVEATKNIVQQWQENNRLPQNVQLTTWYDKSESIMERLSLLVNNAFTGIILVFILLALFLNLSVAIWVAMGLPFIFFGTIYFMGNSYLGLSLNEFTTFGFILALGIVVDDAVVVGESIYTVRSKEGDTLQSTIKGVMQVAVPTLFGVLTTVAAFYALANIDGRMGQLYSQFAFVVTIALMLSIVESKLILPSHLAHLNTHRIKAKNPIAKLWESIQTSFNNGFSTFNDKIYHFSIDIALRYRYAVALLFFAIFILVAAMPFNGTVKLSFFPEIPGETVCSSLSMKTDATYGQTHIALQKIEKAAYQADKNLRQSNPDNTNNNAIGIEHLQLLSESDQAGTVTIELGETSYSQKAFTTEWKKLIGMPEGVETLSVQSSPRMISAFRVELRSNEDAVLSEAGKQFKDALSKIKAVSGIEDNLEPSQPQMKFYLNQQGIAMGFTTDMLAEQLLQTFKGNIVQRFQRGNDEIEVRVRYPESKRQNPLDVINARVRTAQGDVIPLSSIVNFSYGYTRDTITRIDGKRAIYISSDVDKDQFSATELVSILKKSLVPQLERNYPELSIHFAGEAEQQAETTSSMEIMFIMALLMIYILLAVPLKSYVQPLLIMTAIPFGIVGAILGHWFNDISLGILSFNGIIALSGVVVNDSLLLVNSYNNLKKQIASTHDAIIEASHSRLRAVLLTSFTTFAGLMPILSETSHQAQFLIPAAISLAYGIMFATFVTLLFIPAILMIQEDIKKLFVTSNMAEDTQVQAIKEV